MRQIIGGLKVNVVNQSTTKGITYGLTNATIEQVETLYNNLCNKYQSVENHFTSTIDGCFGYNGYYLCK